MFSHPLKKNLARGLVIISLFTGTLSFNGVTHPHRAEAAMAKIKATVNFRNGPSSNYSIIKKLSGGTPVDVILHENSWSKVQVGGTTGYVSNRYINFTSRGFITSRVNLRDQEGMNSNILIKIPAGQDVQILSGPVKSWYKVSWKNFTGYIHQNYLSITTENANILDSPPQESAKTEVSAPNSGYITSTVNLRDRNGMNSKILIKVPAGQTVQVISGPTNGWYNIIWKNINGYIYKNYININKPGSTTEEPPKQASGEDGTYILKAETATYLSSSNALEQINPVSSYSPGLYYQFKTHQGMVNISKTEGQAGAWINPTPTVPSQPAPEASPEPANPYEGYTEVKWTFTFYTNLPSENGGWTTTAMGTPLRYGVLASNYWPLRSKVILPGWGEFTVEDRGGSNFDSKYRMDMLIPRNTGESDYQYKSRIRSMGIQSIKGYIKPYKK